MTLPQSPVLVTPGEALIAEAINLLQIEVGTVTSPAVLAGNVLADTTKNWVVNVHVNRLVKITKGPGVGQTAIVQANLGQSLTIYGTWAVAIGVGSSYMILDVDIAQVIRDTLGGGANVDLPAEFAALIAALAIGLEAAVDSGTATGGTNTTLIDANKDWALGMWGGVRDSLIQVEIAGVNYLRFTALPVNTATVITIAALPAGVVVAAGCPYSIKRALNPILPLAQALLHNVAGYLAAADILAADLAPLNNPCLFRVTACFNAAGILSVQTTNAAGGAGAVVQRFNGGVALNNNSLYEFEHLVHAGDTINYQYSVNATIMTFRVQEIVGAT